jgi:hypothetical protein
MRVTISISGVPEELSAVVLSLERDKLRGKFEFSPAVGENWVQRCAELAKGAQIAAA